ncbi:MAG: hypothetical protein BRC40_05595 [Cyanobacteria bacterium QH_8_48_120]|nr:MAG: hypothetical protein BRC34_03495 [Cyanobacteria bacterium QH_1_48_107]PSO68363.1 MAG: hypothetical protein BRC38_01520 [Cyanobacteria bacterium QH_6_48_35]PSO75233.1 MAG: hypothetical protein BRC40_05595 [Cyanobacteria bacterium QH_8_48_120]
MSATPTKKDQRIQYPERTIKRAELALRCSPFYLKLFAEMRRASIPLPTIAGKTGVQKGYTQRPLSEFAAESGLMWLINVGLLRREVDGQGITDSFRLTPLGHQLVAKWEQWGETMPAPSQLERLRNTLNRWLRLSL